MMATTQSSAERMTSLKWEWLTSTRVRGESSSEWSEMCHCDILGRWIDFDMWQFCVFFIEHHNILGCRIKCCMSDEFNSNQQEFKLLEQHVLWHDQRDRCGSFCKKKKAEWLLFSEAPPMIHFPSQDADEPPVWLWSPLPCLSDASSFPPFLDKSEPLYFFSSDICRWWRVLFCESSFIWSSLTVFHWH